MTILSTTMASFVAVQFPCGRPNGGGPVGVVARNNQEALLREAKVLLVGAKALLVVIMVVLVEAMAELVEFMAGAPEPVVVMAMLVEAMFLLVQAMGELMVFMAGAPEPGGNSPFALDGAYCLTWTAPPPPKLGEKVGGEQVSFECFQRLYYVV